MDTKQLTDALEKLFVEEGERVVFWNDPDKEFLGYMNQQMFSPIEDVEVLRLDKTSSLEVKLHIERDDPPKKYLVYSPSEEPEYEDDWLLDVRLYSRPFRADRASILLDELGLRSQHLRTHIAARRKFFDNKERVAKLKTLVTPDDNDRDLDRKMLAVVTKTEQAELFNIIRTLFHSFTEERELDIGQPPAVWEQIEKFDLDKPLWQMVKTAFGYAEETPTLGNFLIRLCVTDYAQHLKAELAESLTHLQLPAAGRSNAVVCLAQWRDSHSRAASYDLLSAQVANTIRLTDHLHDLEIDDMLDVMTFLDVEKAICRSLRDRVESTADTMNADDVKGVAIRRQAGHWVSSHVPGALTVPRKALNAVYRALTAASEFFDLKNQHQDGFEFDDAAAMYRAYETDLFRFDQLYRHFCEAADTAESQNWDVLKALREQIEAAYVNWYITQESLGWGKFVDGLLSKWQITGVPNQQRFFHKHVRPRLEEAENRKAFVIISDAFRYEIAEELTRELNGKYRFEAELSSQLGVLPSYTRLGMASLLPHQTLSYNAKGETFCDGKPTMSSDQREEILKPLDGMVLNADNLIGMKKAEGRELVGGRKVVYIYHDRIDATGDDRKSEGQAFDAVRKTVDELGDLVRFVVNSLNGNYIVITADHGFLFTESSPGETDKSKLSDKPPGTVEAKKRYLIGHDLGDSGEAWHGNTKTTAGADGGMEFWVPKGANRFHFMGGARFFHGGAMLQEICVPVITIRHRKDKSSREETKTKHVTVHVLGTKHKITTPRHRFELIQMEAVSERVKPITLKVAVYEGHPEGTRPVTNIEKITFDSTSENMDDRKKQVTLTLQDRKFDKKTIYRLVLRDADTGVEQQSVDVSIDRAFTDDF